MLSSIFFPKGNKTNTEIYIDGHPCGCQLDHNIKPILHAISLAVWSHYTESSALCMSYILKEASIAAVETWAWIQIPMWTLNWVFLKKLLVTENVQVGAQGFIPNSKLGLVTPTPTYLWSQHLGGRCRMLMSSRMAWARLCQHHPQNTVFTQNQNLTTTTIKHHYQKTPNTKLFESPFPQLLNNTTYLMYLVLRASQKWLNNHSAKCMFFEVTKRDMYQSSKISTLPVTKIYQCTTLIYPGFK